MPQDLVKAAAYEWWRCHRPVEWTLSEHLENPTINCVTDSEKALAEAVAEYFSE